MTTTSTNATTDLWRLSAAELAAAIRHRQVSVREVIEAHLRRKTVQGPERTVVLLVSRPLADQEPEMGSDDPHAAPLGTVPDTVTVIDADAPLASEKPLQVTVWPWFLGFGLMLSVPALGLVAADAFDSQPAVPLWRLIA